MSIDNQLQLFNLPATDRSTLPYKNRDTFQMGDAAEILTQARLNCWGYPTVKSSPGSVFDLIVDLKSSFLKIQVKGTSVITPKMTFEIRRSSMRAGPRHFSYKEGEFDIAALVSIPDQRVLFYAGVHNRISCKREQFIKDGNEFESWLNALKNIQLKERSQS